MSRLLDVNQEFWVSQALATLDANDSTVVNLGVLAGSPMTEEPDDFTDLQPVTEPNRPKRQKGRGTPVYATCQVTGLVLPLATALDTIQIEIYTAVDLAMTIPILVATALPVAIEDMILGTILFSAPLPQVGLLQYIQMRSTTVGTAFTAGVVGGWLGDQLAIGMGDNR